MCNVCSPGAVPAECQLARFGFLAGGQSGRELPQRIGTGFPIPDEETPLADVPATGDNLIAWILAAGVSGLGLVWLALSGKKRKNEEQE